jgi:cell division protease FtsH
MNSPKTILFWMFIILVGVVFWRMVANPRSSDAERPTFSDFMKQVDQDNVRDITIYPAQNSYDVEGEWREPSRRFRLTIIKESASDLIKELREKGVPINVQELSRPDWINFLLTAAPLFLLVGFWIIMMRQMQAKGKNQ